MDKHQAHSDHKSEDDHEMHDHQAGQMKTADGLENQAMAVAHGEHSGHHDHGEHLDHSSHGDDDHSGHVDHSGHEIMFRDRFWVSLLLSIPVLLFSTTIQGWLGFTMPAIPFSEWITPVLSVIVFIYGGVPFIRMAVPEIRQRQPGMMTLITLAISVSFIYSMAALIFGLGEGFFWELVTLIDVMLLGHWIEMRSVRQASGALTELAKLIPDEAERLLPNGDVEIVAVASLKSGDRILVRPGASVPGDGVIIEGSSKINEAMITGESKPVQKKSGAKVIAGSINGEGSLRIEIGATGEQTALAGIMRLVAEAQQSKSRTQILADQAAGWLFYIAVGVAIFTGVGWSLAQGFNLFALQRVVTVLVIACPHALGLAVPLVVAISTSSAAKNGVLVRDRLALEAAREIDVVVFDKTGTLTSGEQEVVNVQTLDTWSADDALGLAAAVEGDSEHSLAAAIRRSAKAQELKIPKVSEFTAIKGQGVRATWQRKSVYIGGPQLIAKQKITVDAHLQDLAAEAGKKSQSAIYLIVDKQAVALFSLADAIRPESYQTVKSLQANGIEVAMLTGDSQDVADAIAKELGIDHVFAEVLPEEKDTKVKQLQSEGNKVAMVGDGVNDAPALARADVGIAIGSGTDVAMESAGIILINDNPLDVLKIFRLSKASYRKMIQNLIWATGYNLIALPLAAGVLANQGIWLSPAVGALFMSASTVIVAINAQLLRNLNFENAESVVESVA